MAENELTFQQEQSIQHAKQRIVYFQEENRNGWLFNDMHDEDIELWQNAIKDGEGGNWNKLAILILREAVPGQLYPETKLKPEQWNLIRLATSLVED